VFVPVKYISSCKLPTKWGVFDMHGFEDAETGKEHVLLSMGEFQPDDIVLARVHSECLTGDALFSQRCDCGHQLELAMKRIAELGQGVILYLRQEGRGIGLLNKIKAYHLQDGGADTVEANEQLGFGADLRDYTMCQSMFAHLGISRVRLMTNNPAKMQNLLGQGIEVVNRIPHYAGENDHNRAYLQTKAGKMGHLFEPHSASSKTEDEDWPFLGF